MLRKSSERIFWLVLLFVAAIPLQAQNQLDSLGRKTGHWIVVDDEGNKLYEATFKTGLPVGLMKRFYKTGDVSAEMRFDTLSYRCYAKMFYKNQRLAAEGWFIEQKKDSVWTYYSEYDGCVRIREPYNKGNLEGTAVSYYPNGQIAEEMEWSGNIRHGKWLQYYDDGGLKSKGSYLNGLLEGVYQSFRTDSTLELQGNYRENVADGNWILYNTDGSVSFIYKYHAGVLLNEDEMLDNQDVVLQKLQEIPDPDPTDDFK